MTEVRYVPGSHLDLYWLGSYLTCLERGAHILKAYLDRCLETDDETFMIETVVFAQYFLRRHPEYADPLRRLLAEGRVDIGAAYIDRWENLVLAESLIRNVQLGKAWLRDTLGHDSRIALHPDLPGLNPQTPQIYSSAGVDFYASARKIFPEGRVWKAQAPDGTTLLMLRWPGHYNFIPLELTDLHSDFPQWGDWTLDLNEVEDRFPAGVVAVSAAAGDLTDPADFVLRYGADLRDFVDRYRMRHPEISFGYTTPTAVLSAYQDIEARLPVVLSGIPSVWGVAADESARFFRRSRENEALLLTAETAAVLSRSHSRPAFPETSVGWVGAFDEQAFFARKDPIRPGNELSELWRSHVFTLDHNGGGQEGMLSSFQKRVRQDRLTEYATEVLQHTVGDGDRLLVLNPRLDGGAGPLVVDPGTSAGVLLQRQLGVGRGVQDVVGPDGEPLIAVDLPDLPAIAITALGPDGLRAVPSDPEVADGEHEVVVRTSTLEVRIDRTSGSVAVRDLVRDVLWGTETGLLTAVAETGNDVTLAVDEGAKAAAVCTAVRIVTTGALCTQVAVDSRLVAVDWMTLVTVWNASPRVDLDISTRWPGTTGWQIRCRLTDRADVDRLTYGSPLHATPWTQVPEGAAPRVSDEIAVTDFADYREVQHWIHCTAEDGGLTIATATPGVRHHDGRLDAVLMRTSTSCGDDRFTWDNHGHQTWRFQLVAGDADWLSAGAPEIGDRLWRPPVLAAGDAGAVGPSLLRSTGDPVHLSALAPNEERVFVRLANLAPTPAEVILVGPLARGAVEPVSLAGEPVPLPIDRPADDAVHFTLRPWQLQTLHCDQPLLTPDRRPEMETA